jgi:hypothetical protein
MGICHSDQEDPVVMGREDPVVILLENTIQIHKIIPVTSSVPENIIQKQNDDAENLSIGSDKANQNEISREEIINLPVSNQFNTKSNKKIRNFSQLSLSGSFDFPSIGNMHETNIGEMPNYNDSNSSNRDDGIFGNNAVCDCENNSNCMRNQCNQFIDNEDIGIPI